jgi:hypothetical protein
MRNLSAAAAFVLVLALPGDAAAHRLDEYLQAARIALDRDAITLEVDLTPGAGVAQTVIAIIDRDNDGTISPAEAEAYARTALSDLVFELDGRTVAMTLTHAEVPAVAEMLAGTGTIQLRAVAAGRYPDGHRILQFSNNHQPDISVYMVNALMPESEGVAVLAQTRDPRQRSARLEYQIGSRWHSQLGWFFLGSAGLCALVGLRTGRLGRPLSRTAS